MGVQRPTRAAQYLRMSTERQDLSIELQMAAIAAYALERGYSVVQTYADKGISGVGIDRRDGLKRLIADVIGGDCGFEVVMVYDVSRWGRFQNPDQAAHYEFLCAEAGVSIEYCAEPFENDGSAMATLLKSMKRAMAAEYTRELSAKVRQAHQRVKALGFWMGGAPGYGLRRQVVTRTGKVIGVRERGERKGIPGAHVVLVPGPPEEVATVRRMYRMFARQGETFVSIAKKLNADGITAEHGGRWTHQAVSHVLTSPKYVGQMVSYKEVRTIGAHAVTKPREEWEYFKTSCPPIVSRGLFAEVRRALNRRHRQLTDEEMLDDLRDILRRHGRLTTTLVNAEARRSANVYAVRFRHLLTAFRMVGYIPTYSQEFHSKRASRWRRGRPVPSAVLTDQECLDALASLYQREGRLSSTLIKQGPETPQPQIYRVRFGSLLRAYELVGYQPTPVQLARSAPGSPSRAAGAV